MALYYNGDNVSSINFTPQLTLAEYNALSIKPKYWIRTDAGELDSIPSSEISYDNTDSELTSTNVQDAIDEIDGKISGIELGTGLEFEVGQFPTTYGSLSGNVTGVKITNTGNNRYAIIGTEIAGGTLNMGSYIYNSWNNDTVRIDGNNNVKTATSSTHTANIQYIQIGRIVMVYGSYVPKTSSTEGISTTLPKPTGIYTVPFRTQSGNMGLIYLDNDAKLQQWNHTGTITADQAVFFNFTYIANNI